MHRYTVWPVDASCEPVEVVSNDAGPVLNAVERLAGKAADVFEDGVYFCSVHLSPSGMWSISRNREVV